MRSKRKVRGKGGNGRAATIPPSEVEAASRGKTRVLACGSVGPALRWPTGAPQRGARHQPENRWQWSRCDHSAERSRGGIARQDARFGLRFRRPCASLADGRPAARGAPPTREPVAMVALRPFRRAKSRRHREARRAFWPAVPSALRFAGRRAPRSAGRATNRAFTAGSVRA